MRTLFARVLPILLLASVAMPAFAQKKKKGGGDEEAAPPPPAETKDQAKKKRKKQREAEATPDAPPAAPAEPGKGDLKPGQGVGMRQCLGSSANINIEATSKSTVGVATCRMALEKVFTEKGLCDGKKGQKLEYSWQFADTTGLHTFTCR
jgi:hypothetical protein